MPCRTDCAHSVPVRSRRCLLAHRGSCDACRDFVGSDIEREPTGHPWILTTNKYYKQSDRAGFDKGIITQGRTYVYGIYDCGKYYTLSVRRDDALFTSIEIPKPVRFGLAIKLGDAALRLLVSADIQEGKNHA